VHLPSAILILNLAFLGLMAAPATAAPAEEKQGVLQVVSMEALGELHRVRAYAGRKSTFLHLGDIADAVGGAWGRDPLSREPLFTLGQNRVLFSSGDRRIAVNGRRRKLSAPVEFRQGGIYVPEDFLEEILEPMLGEPVRLLSTPRPMPAPAGEEAPDRKADDPPRGRSGQDQDARRDQGDARSSDWFLDRERSGRGLQRVVLDPGHGGEEEGAAGPSGLLEKNLVLDVSRRLLLALQLRGFDVSLTRTSDKDLPLDERTAIANNRRADLFLSLHANASPSTSARGAETYYLSLRNTADNDSEGLGGHETSTLMGSGQDDPLKLVLWDMAQTTWLAESQLVAELIQAEFNEALGIPDRGVKRAPFRVLVGATMPAALVEIGFISNPEEEARLRDPVFLDQIVGALVRAIEGYRDRTARRPAFQPRP
jgi:N-acetylmuramoyl-L-alanine amidase